MTVLFFAVSFAYCKKSAVPTKVLGPEAKLAVKLQAPPLNGCVILGVKRVTTFDISHFLVCKIVHTPVGLLQRLNKLMRESA